MNHKNKLRKVVSLLRITIGLILVVTWYDNLQKGVYTADGIIGLFNGIFNDTGGGPAFYQALINSTILQIPGPFGLFQMVAELLMGLALLFGVLTPLAAAGATLFFFNLFLAYFGGHEWIWTYVLLTVSALVTALTQAGRAWGVDQMLLKRFGEPPTGLLW